MKSDAFCGSPASRIISPVCVNYCREWISYDKRVVLRGIINAKPGDRKKRIVVRLMNYTNERMR